MGAPATFEAAAGHLLPPTAGPSVYLWTPLRQLHLHGISRMWFLQRQQHLTQHATHHSPFGSIQGATASVVLHNPLSGDHGTHKTARARFRPWRPSKRLNSLNVLPPQKALCGGIPCSFLEPFARSWSHFVDIHRQKSTRSLEN